MKKVLVVDAYDSFVHIIRNYLVNCGLEATMVRNDKLSLSDIDEHGYDFILLGPGPGHPSEAGYVEIIRRYRGVMPILGVCLGHQAIGLAFGCRVAQAKHLMHGKVSRIEHQGTGVFEGLPDDFQATRYHSLVVDEEGLSPDMEVTATSQDDGYIMGMRHRRLPIEGIQFHPESITTPSGIRLFQNFIRRHT